MKKLSQYMDCHETHILEVLTSLGIPVSSGLDAADLERLFMLIDEKLTDQELDYFFMELDVDFDGRVTALEIQEGIDKVVNKDCEFFDSESFDNTSNASSQFIRIKSEHKISYTSFDEYGIESMKIIKPTGPVPVQFINEKIMEDLYKNNKLSILCQNISKTLESKGCSLGELFTRYTRYNPISIFSNEKREDMLAY